MKIKLDFWELLEKEIKSNYGDKVFFLQDDNLSFFDDEEIPTNPQCHVFDSIDEFYSWEENRWFPESEDLISIVDSLSILWVNGVKSQKIIYKLRG